MPALTSCTRIAEIDTNAKLCFCGERGSEVWEDPFCVAHETSTVVRLFGFSSRSFVRRGIGGRVRFFVWCLEGRHRREAEQLAGLPSTVPLHGGGGQVDPKQSGSCGGCVHAARGGVHPMTKNHRRNDLRRRWKKKKKTRSFVHETRNEFEEMKVMELFLLLSLVLSSSGSLDYYRQGTGATTVSSAGCRGIVRTDSKAREGVR